MRLSGRIFYQRDGVEQDDHYNQHRQKRKILLALLAMQFVRHVLFRVVVVAAHEVQNQKHEHSEQRTEYEAQAH